MRMSARVLILFCQGQFIAKWFTVFDVLFFRFWARSMYSNWGERNCSAIAFTQEGTVAEKRST